MKIAAHVDMKKLCERCFHSPSDHEGNVTCRGCAREDLMFLCTGYVNSDDARLGEQLAKDVLSVAASGGMPDSVWATDERVQRACTFLGWDYTRAREWARENAPRRVS